MEFNNYCRLKTQLYTAVVAGKLTMIEEFRFESRHLWINPRGCFCSLVQVRMQQYHRAAPRPYVRPEQAPWWHRDQGWRASHFYELRSDCHWRKAPCRSTRNAQCHRRLLGPEEGRHVDLQVWWRWGQGSRCSCYAHLGRHLNSQAGDGRSGVFVLFWPQVCSLRTWMAP